VIRSINPGSRQLTQKRLINVIATKGQYINAVQLGKGEFASNIPNQSVSPLKPATNGTVKNAQNGQHGPATTIGDPSRDSQRKNILPTLREKQQNNEKQSSEVPVQNLRVFPFSSCFLSHANETAYCFLFDPPCASLILSDKGRPSTSIAVGLWLLGICVPLLIISPYNDVRILER
jgi:hypothetical protein